MQTLFIFLVAIIIVGGGAYWYMGQQTPNINVDLTPTTNTPVTTPTPPSPAPAATSTRPTVSAVKEVTVTNTGMAFDQKTLTVKKGDTFKVTFKNTGGMHDFVLDEFSGARTKVIQAGQQETVTFVADKAGSFEYYCSVGQHRANGMWGTLTVTE